MSNNLNSMIAEYEYLLGYKAELEQATKDNNQDLKDIQKKIIDEMVDQDMPSVTLETEGYGTYTYTPQVKTRYSLLGEEKAEAKGLDRFNVLRDNDLGYLIKESVNQNSFNAAIRERIARLDKDEELPEDLEAVISSYDEQSISRTKANGKNLKKLRESK